MLKRFLLATVACASMGCAQQAPSAQMVKAQTVNARGPVAAGANWPMPPQQNAPWAHPDDAFARAAATLFEQGLADPRGLEYREIEIAVGNPWDGGGAPVVTRGWVLPDGDENARFAVAWNGLVYPILRVGKAADWHADAAAQLAQTGRRSLEATAEGDSVNAQTFGALKAVLLLRLGAPDEARRLFRLQSRPAATDPYLSLAQDWTWFAFERAVTAHQRGDDDLARAGAQMLTRVAPLIEAEAKKRGYKARADESDSRFPNRTLPYLAFLAQVPTLLRDSKRRVEHPKPPAKTDARADIAALIADLQNVDERQMGQPGGVSLAQDKRVQALVERGGEAVEPLIDALERDERLTRSVSFGRDFFRNRHLISVSEAALAALQDFTQVNFKTYDAQGQPLTRAEIAHKIRAYWSQMGDKSPAERFYATLGDDTADPNVWLEAAANLVQPTDVETHGGWTTLPNRKPGQKIVLRGEPLRDGRAPSVAQLMARRSDDIAAIRTQSSRDSFLFIDASQMALHLAKWDAKAAVPTLKTRLARAYSIGEKPDDILAFNNEPVEKFGGIIAQMTLALARGGDGAAYDEYARWIREADLKSVTFSGDELQKPLIQGAARPSIGRAIDYLFNDPKSAWSNVLAQRNGFWLLDFWGSPLPMTHGFGKQAMRALSDKTPAGTITFNARKDWNGSMEAQIQTQSMNMGFRGSNGDAATPLAGQKRAFRVCDLFAYFYAKHHNGPPIQLFWPQPKRDAAVEACRQWLIKK